MNGIIKKSIDFKEIYKFPKHYEKQDLSHKLFLENTLSQHQ